MHTQTKHFLGHSSFCLLKQMFCVQRSVWTFKAVKLSAFCDAQTAHWSCKDAHGVVGKLPQ